MIPAGLWTSNSPSHNHSWAVLKSHNALFPHPHDPLKTLYSPIITTAVSPPNPGPSSPANYLQTCAIPLPSSTPPTPLFPLLIPPSYIPNHAHSATSRLKQLSLQLRFPSTQPPIPWPLQWPTIPSHHLSPSLTCTLTYASLRLDSPCSLILLHSCHLLPIYLPPSCTPIKSLYFLIDSCHSTFLPHISISFLFTQFHFSVSQLDHHPKLLFRASTIFPITHSCSHYSYAFQTSQFSQQPLSQIYKVALCSGYLIKPASHFTPKSTLFSVPHLYPLRLTWEVQSLSQLS